MKIKKIVLEQNYIPAEDKILTRLVIYLETKAIYLEIQPFIESRHFAVDLRILADEIENATTS